MFSPFKQTKAMTTVQSQSRAGQDRGRAGHSYRIGQDRTGQDSRVVP